MKSTKSIRDILFNELDEVAKGGDIKKAKVVAKLSSQAIYATRVELENKKIELELAKSDDKVKAWMDKDFSTIQNIKMGE